MSKSFRKVIREAYKGTPQYRLDRIQKEISKWQRRETIARNKLADARGELDAFAAESAAKLLKESHEQNT